MATASTGKTRCIRCNKEKATLRCEGCLQHFCFNDWEPHRQELTQKLDQIHVNRDVFRQLLTQQSEDSNNYSLIQQINQWEERSINIIRQTAEQARKTVLSRKDNHIHKLELKLNELTKQLRESREENDVNEINLQHFQEELDKLTRELNKPTNICIREEQTTFITKICVNITNFDEDTKWIQNGITIAGGNGEGDEINQLNHPTSICIDNKNDVIYIADAWNHRIMEYTHGQTQCQIVAGGNGSGSNMNQFNGPVDVIMDNKKQNLIICDCNNRRIQRWPLLNGSRGETIISNIDCCRIVMDNIGFLYVSDHKKHEVRRWKIGDREGLLVAGGNGQGNRLDQLDLPTFIFVDQDDSVYVSDCENHRIMKWIPGAKEGIVVVGLLGKGNGLAQLSRPEGLFVDSMGTVYVADSENHRVMRWLKGARQGTVVVGGNGCGNQNNQFSDPYGLSFDSQGNLYIADWKNNRVQKFSIDRSLTNLFI